MANLIKIKWNRLKSNLTLSEIASYIKNNKYSERLGYGYSDFVTSSDSLSATYTESKLNTQTSVDPLGNENEQEFVTYESIHFAITKLTGRLYLLSVFNPPKSIKALTNRLSEDSGYKIGFSIVDIHLSEYLSSLCEKYNIDLVSIKKVKISSLIVNDNAKATLEILSKKNALEDLKDIIQDKAFSLDKIKAVGYFSDKTCSFEISKTGSAYADELILENLTRITIEQILAREL